MTGEEKEARGPAGGPCEAEAGPRRIGADPIQDSRGPGPRRGRVGADNTPLCGLDDGLGPWYGPDGGRECGLVLWFLG
jgi:hypothetical protein